MFAQHPMVVDLPVDPEDQRSVLIRQRLCTALWPCKLLIYSIDHPIDHSPTPTMLSRS